MFSLFQLTAKCSRSFMWEFKCNTFTNSVFLFFVVTFHTKLNFTHLWFVSFDFFSRIYLRLVTIFFQTIFENTSSSLTGAKVMSWLKWHNWDYWPEIVRSVKNKIKGLHCIFTSCLCLLFVVQILSLIKGNPVLILEFAMLPETSQTLPLHWFHSEMFWLINLQTLQE